MTLPLWVLLLILSATTHIQPPAVPESQMVEVRELPSGIMGYNCGTIAGMTALCAPERASAVQLSPDLWADPLLMQHLAMHEYGHTLYGSSEDEAERYACQTAPIAVTVSGVTCRP